MPVEKDSPIKEAQMLLQTRGILIWQHKPLMPGDLMCLRMGEYQYAHVGTSREQTGELREFSCLYDPERIAIRVESIAGSYLGQEIGIDDAYSRMRYEGFTPVYKTNTTIFGAKQLQESVIEVM